MTLADAGHHIAADLIRDLDLEPIAIDPSLVSHVGQWRGQPATIHTRAFASPRIRYARFVEVAGEDLAIANLLCLPEPALQAPMLGIDLVHARAGHTVVVADLLPGVPTGETSAGAPRWAEQFFSRDALMLRPEAGQVDDALAAAAGRAASFRDQVRAAHKDGLASTRSGWQDAYCHAHRRDDRALGLLARIFGEAWSARFLTDVLFPVASGDEADLAILRLRAATSRAHERVEAKVGLMDPAITEDAYRWFIAATSACAIPLEAQVAALAPAGVPIGCVNTPRAQWLSGDLRALAIDSLPGVTAPSLDGWPQAVGAAYVLEGATLGGQVLLRHLTGRLSLGESAYAYLRSYGGETGERWRQCRSYVGAFMATSAAAERDVIAGAAATFAAFERAYDTRG